MNKNFIIIILLVFNLFLVSCNLGQIEDRNGDDNFTIETISDEDIIKKDNYVSFGSVSSSTTNNSKLSTKKFSGIKELNRFYSFGILNFKSEVFSGNFRVVLIANNKIVIDLDINGSSSVNVEKGYILKIVGETANFKIEYNFE